MNAEQNQVDNGFIILVQHEFGSVIVLRRFNIDLWRYSSAGHDGLQIAEDAVCL